MENTSIREAIAKHKKISVPLLQRELEISYTDARLAINTAIENGWVNGQCNGVLYDVNTSCIKYARLTCDMQDTVRKKCTDAYNRNLLIGFFSQERIHFSSGIANTLRCRLGLPYIMELERKKLLYRHNGYYYINISRSDVKVLCDYIKNKADKG